MSAVLHTGDCLDVLRTLPDSSVDAVVTDPPYGLAFMGKRWDYDVPTVEVWAECLRVLKPGGHLLAFFGTRTYHRGACRIEDAGFEIRDQLGWMYGSGFPKSHDVSKAIDKAAGAEREVVGRREHHAVADSAPPDSTGSHIWSGLLRSSEPATDAARQWQGWGTALKPAWEPIALARKPLIGTVAANVLEHGTGALNVDGCRVQTGDKLGGGMVSMGRPKVSEGWDRPWMHDAEVTERKKAESAVKVSLAESLGRFPANLVHDGSDEVADLLGNATRFFYCAKASRNERGEANGHPTVKPVALMRYLVRLVTPPGCVVLDPFMGSGTTGVACVLEGMQFIGIEQDPAYVEIARQRIDAAGRMEPKQADMFKESSE